MGNVEFPYHLLRSRVLLLLLLKVGVTRHSTNSLTMHGNARLRGAYRPETSAPSVPGHLTLNSEVSVEHPHWVGRSPTGAVVPGGHLGMIWHMPIGVARGGTGDGRHVTHT